MAAYPPGATTSEFERTDVRNGLKLRQNADGPECELCGLKKRELPTRLASLKIREGIQ